MTNTVIRHTERQRSQRRRWILGISTLAIAALLGVAALARGGTSSDPGAASTGEKNAMGMPIVATPGAGSGVAEGDGIAATPGLWALDEYR